MSLWADIKQRRITQIFISYLVGGWIILQVVDQTVDREVLPRYVYLVALILFGFGIPIALIIGWYHGEKGAQEATKGEIAMVSVLSLAALAASALVVQNSLRADELRSRLDVDLTRVGVLYFSASDPDAELVAEGLTEDLIGRLARVPELDVVSRYGAREVRDRGLTLEEAAEFLEVGTIMEGDVRRSGDEMVVSVQLRTSDGIPIASVSTRGPSDEIIELQGQVARDVEEQIREELGAEIRLRESRSEAPNNGAWLAATRGERSMERAMDAMASAGWDEAAPFLNEAEASFEEAAELGDEWAEPWQQLARTRYERGRFSSRDPDVRESLFQEGLAFADEALDRDPRSAIAYYRRGSLHYIRYQLGLDESDAASEASLEAAQRDLETATDLDPSLADAFATLSHLFYQVEDPTGAALAARQAYEADAFLTSGSRVLERLFLTNYDLEEADRARDWCAEGYRRFPDDFFFTECRLYLMTMTGIDPDISWAWALRDTLELVATETEVERFSTDWTQVVGGVIARAGYPDSASAVMDRAPGSPSIEAAMRILNEEYETAVDLLLEYTAGTGGHFGEGTGLMWWWRPLQGRPEFERLRRLN